MPGSPYGMPRSQAAIDKFRKRYVIEDHGFTSPCWQWTGPINNWGYAHFHADAFQCRGLRFAYTHFVGEIPEGLHIDHLCRNRACVNPEHLEAVTPAENTRRASAARTHCKRGHPWVADNWKFEGKRRFCRICREASVAKALLAKTDRVRLSRAVREPVSRMRAHCKRGHAFAPENTIIAQGVRLCRTCRRQTQIADNNKRREARHALKVAACGVAGPCRHRPWERAA